MPTMLSIHKHTVFGDYISVLSFSVCVGSCVVTPHYSYGMPATATHPTPLFDSTYPGFPANIKMEPLSFEPSMSMYQPLHISTASSTYSSSSSMMGNNGHSGPSMFYTNTSMHDSLLSEVTPHKDRHCVHVY